MRYINCPFKSCLRWFHSAPLRSLASTWSISFLITFFLFAFVDWTIRSFVLAQNSLGLTHTTALQSSSCGMSRYGNPVQFPPRYSSAELIDFFNLIMFKCIPGSGYLITVDKK